MAENTKIEWADDSVGFWWGCTEHGPECAHCYARDGYAVSIAEAQMELRLWASNRKSGDPPAVRLKIESAHDLMRRLNRKAEREGRPRIVFINSQSDTFEDTDAVIVRRLSPKVAAEKGCKYQIAYEFEGGIRWHSPNARIGGVRLWNLNDERREMFRTIDECSHLRCLLLTKRPENIRRMWALKTYLIAACDTHIHYDEQEEAFRENVFLGVSAGTQETADRNIPELLKCRDLAPVLFVSAEPLLEAVDLHQCGGVLATTCRHVTPWKTRPCRECADAIGSIGAIDWCIVGGESGHGARPMHPDWARSIRDQCAAAGVAFHFKQNGEWLHMSQQERSVEFPDIVADGANGCPPGGWPESRVFRWPDGEQSYRVGKKAAGRLLDGREWNEFPSTDAAARQKGE